MGMTHGEPDTYPRAADVMGFCATRDAIAVAEAVVTVQRDWGDRTNRKHARLKYTIEDRGLDAFRAEVEKRAGVTLDAPKPFTFTSTGDRYGWIEGEDGKAHLTLYVPNGRIQDTAGSAAMLTGLRKIAEIHKGDMRLTANQNVIVANVAKEDRVDDRGDRDALSPGAADVRPAPQFDGLRRAADLRPGARRERALPARSDRRARRTARGYGLSDDDIVIRMTGCPNGCARPYLSEIGLVGKGPGRYNLYLGAAFDVIAPLQALRRRPRARRDHRGARSAVCGLCERARAGRALRRLRDPRGLRGEDRQRPRLPRKHRGERAHEWRARSSRRALGLSPSPLAGEG